VNWAYSGQQHANLAKSTNTPVEKALEPIVERGAKLTNHPKS
jgi:trehalose utilization protein